MNKKNEEGRQPRNSFFIFSKKITTLFKNYKLSSTEYPYLSNFNLYFLFLLLKFTTFVRFTQDYS